MTVRGSGIGRRRAKVSPMAATHELCVHVRVDRSIDPLRAGGCMGLVLALAMVMPSAGLRGQEEDRPPPETEGEQRASDPVHREDGDDGGGGTDEEIDEPLSRIRIFVTDVERRRARHVEKGLEMSAFLVPDMLAYRVGKLYVESRMAGRDHLQAIRQASASLEHPERLEERAGVVVRLGNADPGAGDSQRVFTIEERFPDEVLRLVAGSEERKLAPRSIPVRLGNRPENLRLASLRIKKFYRLGKRRRVNRREAVVSRPFRALVLEKKPVAADLVFPRRWLHGLDSFELQVDGIKVYVGPFAGGQLDLNQGRTWESVGRQRLRLDLPPEGLEVPRELQEVVRLVEVDR